ncbi:MAG TPA: LysR family transcriptional regulator [Burkholderiaceae bacterium]|nr:LysR family transcriptional regulator [Burkholderiaceae bacterium]
MELYQLRTFVAVAEEGHLTRAAERLHLSQPAVSGQIKALEQEFDLRLFERTANGMTLTVSGRELLTEAQRVLAAAEALRQAARRMKGELAGRLRVGTVSDPEFIRLGELLSLAVQRHPHLELELQHGVTGATLEAVREGRLDATFFYGAAPEAALTAIPLLEFDYVVTAPASWAERVMDADWSAIAALPWILTPEISTHRHLVNGLFAAHGIAPPQEHVAADQEPVLVSLVTSGVGLTLMREDVARLHAQQGDVLIWDKARLRTTLWFVASAERSGDPLLRAVFDLVREIWKTAPAAPPRRARKAANRLAAAA